MATGTLEERVEKLENKIKAMEDRLAEQAKSTDTRKKGWRWFVGIYADKPDFEEVVRIGQEWRHSDRPRVDENKEA